MRRPLASVLILPVCALLWQSFFWIPDASLPVKAGYAGLTLLAAARPRDALLIVTALATLATPLSWLIGTPAKTGEAMVLAFLTGWIARAAVRREPLLPADDSLRRPLVLFAVTVGASLAVVMTMIQAAVGPALPFVERASSLLARTYLHGSAFEIRNWYEAALLGEGGLLAAAVIQLTHRREDLQSAMARMFAAGIAGAALLPCARVATALLRSPDPAEMLVRFITSIRLTSHVTDLNAAGSHLALALPVIWSLGVVAGRAGRGRARSAGWFLAAIPVLAALWLTGSRAAQFGLLIAAAAAAALRIGRRRRLTLALIALGLAVLVSGVVAARPGPRASLPTTLLVRKYFTQMSWEMFRSAPVFGVGVGEYYRLSERMMPVPLRRMYTAEHAHNNFFQVGTELGTVGLALFLWLLAAAGRRIARGFGTSPPDPLLLGLATGLAAAVLTFLTGHPLVVGAFACSFWMALALAVSRADWLAGPAAERAPGTAVSAAVSPWLSPGRLTAAAIALMVLLVPVRAHLARARVGRPAQAPHGDTPGPVARSLATMPGASRRPAPPRAALPCRAGGPPAAGRMANRSPSAPWATTAPDARSG